MREQPQDGEDGARELAQLVHAYRREAAPEPPAALDAAVLEEARERRELHRAAPSRRSSPVGIAASVLFAAALALAVIFGPGGAKQASESPQVIRASYQPAVARTPQAWLADIHALRRAGHEAEAAAQLREFHADYPAYEIDRFE